MEGLPVEQPVRRSERVEATTHERTGLRVEPVDVVMSLTINGEVRSSGTGAACLGDPLEALRWLANNPAAPTFRVLEGLTDPVTPPSPIWSVPAVT